MADLNLSAGELAAQQRAYQGYEEAKQKAEKRKADEEAKQAREKQIHDDEMLAKSIAEEEAAKSNAKGDSVKLQQQAMQHLGRNNNINQDKSSRRRSSSNDDGKKKDKRSDSLAFSQTDYSNNLFHYEDDKLLDSTPTEVRSIKSRKIILYSGLSAITFVAIIFIIAIIMKKRREAVEKARKAIIIETPLQVLEMTNEKTTEKVPEVQQVYYGAPVLMEKSSKD